MRSFTKLWLMVAMVFLASSVVFSQSNAGMSLEEIKDNRQKQELKDPGTIVEVPYTEPGNTRAVGDDCTDPIIISIPADLPYNDNNTTCGRLNTYQETCLGSYDGGEDIIYRLDVTSDITVNINMDPLGTTWTGLALLDGCPDVGACLDYITGSSGTTVKSLVSQELTAGNSYYIMVDTWPSPTCIPSFDLEIVDATPSFTPITTFPFFEDFESGALPAEMTTILGGNCANGVDTEAAYNGTYGAFYEGGTATGYGTYTNGDDAFTNNSSHIAQSQMQIVPDGTAGPLTLKFWMQMTYTYNQVNYNWFRVTVNGVPIADADNGIIYPRPSTPDLDPFMEWEYDLSPWQNDPVILVAIQGCGKYYAGYTTSYAWGDRTRIDDLQIFYKEDPGVVEGYVFNYDGLTISGATVVHEMTGTSTVTGPDGFYSLGPLPTGDQEIIAGKEGYNLSMAMVAVPSGDTTNYDFTLTQPNMVVAPLTVTETLNPEEYFTFDMSVLNNGNGPLEWEAMIVYPPSDGISLETLFAENTITPVEPQGDPSGLAPFITDPSVYNIPVLDGTRDDDSEAFGYNAYSAGGDPNGSYTFILNNPGSMTQIGPAAADFIAGADFGNDEYYGCIYGGTWVTMDPETGVITTIGSCPDFSGVAFDHTTDTWYGVTFAGQLYTVDPVTGTSTLVGTGLSGMIAMACDADGILYGIDLNSDSFGTIDKASGAWSAIGPLGVDVNYAQDMGCDRSTNTIYWAAYTLTFNTGQLYTIDQTTGTPTLIGGFQGGAEITGFGVPGGGGGGGAGDWLTMDRYEGAAAAFGGVDNIPTHMDASGAMAGEVYNAEIVFTSMPNVGTITVPVTMIIAGDPLAAVDELTVELTDDLLGEVSLSWTLLEGGTGTLQYYLIKREGSVIATTTDQFYTDLLPDYGTYCYTVEAVYAEGSTAPAGPECVEWPLPVLFVSPDDLEGWVWVGYTVDVFTTISNLGVGTLEFTFPEFAAMDLVTNPDIEQNQTGAPYSNRSVETVKGEDPYAGTGYPVVLGAGGPDDFGYVWIDSDESGGPTYNWMDISTTGTVVGGLGDDNAVGPFPIGFTFPFYGEEKTEFYVQSNGMISFGSAYITLGNVSIPTGNATYTDMIAWFWDDLDPANPNTTVWYESDGDKLIVQFDTYYEYPDGGNFIDAQVVMYKNGRILIQYDYIEPGFDIDGGTVGIQSSDPGLGLQVAYNTNYIEDGLALLFDLPADFIVDVEPAWGLIPENGSRDITITYDSEGYDPGDYTQELLLESNDPNNLEYIIDNTMHVYLPAQYAGTVVDNNDGQGLPGVLVTAGAFNTTTDEQGNYSLLVDEGTYDVFFDKLGFQTVVVADTFAAEGMITPIDVGMWDVNYPPAGVTATPNAADTECLVEWMLPQGPYEIQLDDGSAEDFALWDAAGSQNAVKFTPNGYPATVIGGRIYVGDGSFPAPFLGTEFGVAVYDDDGPDGMPGTMLDSGGVTVNNYGWVDFDWLSATITDGDFYLAMIQTTNAPGAAPIGVDEDSPTYFMSYSKFQDNDWMMSVFQDFMMRAWVSGPQSDNSDGMVEGTELKYPAKPVGYGVHWYSMSGEAPHILPGVEKAGRYRSIEGMTSRDVVNYRVARYSNFDPNGNPEAGDLTELATTGGLSYNDLAFGGLPQGWYAYGVKALYTSGEYSDYAVSNIVGHLMDFEVTVNVTLTTGEDPINVEIMMQGLDWPYETYMATTPVSGTVVFDEVWLGNYYVSAYKIGYDLYEIESIFINEDREINIVLAEKAYPPTNLYVDPLTLDATWNEPFITTLMEDFEDAAFPPVGWQSLTEGEGWFRTDDGGSASFPIPTWDSYYACNNDDAAGSTNPGANDYLITPPMDLRESPGFMMMFDSYYDGSFSQLATVEYTTDGGATWEILYQLPPAGGAWQQIELDLEAFSGANGVPQIWFAFHSDDAGQWASGWAVDNPVVQVPDPAANYIDFHVFLDGAFVGSTEETAWNYAPLTYGVEYEASVAARYTSGLSEKDYYTFLCVWLIPPRNLVGIAPDDAAILYWEPPLEPGGMFTVVSEEPRAAFPNVNSEYSPTVRTIEANTTGTRDPWDLQLSFATADNSGEAGAESDGDYLYTTMWNGSGFQQYELDGTYIGPLSAGGVGSLRDIAYDPTTGHMFGGAATSTINEMDLTAGTLIGTFTAPTDARAIAYDDVVDGFWANNWSTTITQFDKTGAQLNSFPVGSFGSYYGFAFDTWTEGGPFLWGFSQDGSGNVIVQIEVATGLETGFTQDVSGLLITGTGIAGGLFTHPNLVGNTVSIGGNSQNDVYFLYELTADGGPQPGQVPANLLGYNIYRFDEFVDYVSRDFLTYVDEGLQPAVYDYYVTGVYDLEPYGFPGEEGESMKEGPATIQVDYCYDLEFMETFELGSFDPNNWDATGNWTINGQAGNPAPSAEFTWDPIQTEYEWGMTTYPLCAQGITEGDIWIDFDVKLESVNSTGEEYLHLQVWNWDSQEFATVATYSNIDGSFDFMNEHVMLTSAKGKVFKVRFLAQGMNSLDILSWWVDNVHIYRFCEGVTDVAAMEVGDDYDDIMVSWSLPSGGLIDEWIHWDTGMNTGNSIGTNSAVEFDAAARWEPDQIAEYEGASITEVAFFPAEAAATYSIRIWTGGSLTGGPANLIVDQPVAAPLIGQWNYVALDTPPLLDVTQELWVGYYVNTTTGYPAGCDDGPSVDGYGNMMNFGGWQTLLQINPELDYNWNVQAHLQTLSGDDVTLPSLPMEAYEQTGTLELTSGNTVVQGVAASTANRILTGANVYRSVDGGEYEFLAFVAAPAQEYMDENITTPGINHCYKVTAVYESDIDFCESDYSDEACAFVTVGIGEQTAGAFRMYPNPATDYVMVTSSSDLQRISVYTAMGKLVTSEEIAGNEYELKTSGYTPGVYMIRVETVNGVTTEMLNVQR